MNQKRIQAVAFDLGGVLIELDGLHPFGPWIEDRPMSESFWRRWLASPAVRAFDSGRITPEAFADALINEFDLAVDSERFLTAFAAWPRGMFPGAAALVRRVGNRCVCATLSNTNELHWTRFLQEMRLGEMFQHHFVSHLMGKVKPDLAVFEHVISALGCAPSEILFLDDQPLNVEAARQVGIESVRAAGVEAAAEALLKFGVLEP